MYCYLVYLGGECTMQEIQEVILRKFLKRKIADKNRAYNGMTKGFQMDAKIYRGDIYRQFARGNAWLGRINDDIEQKHNDLSAYNYFDLDTLIAYDAFLGKILEEAESSKRRNRRGYFMSRDFGNAINRTIPEFFLTYGAIEDTGYYNARRTITPLLDDKNRLIYERTPDKTAFEKKYNIYELNKLLATYLDEKHPRKTNKKEEYKDNFQEEFEEYEEPIIEVQNYRGMNYNITKMKMYFDMYSTPIKYVEGYTEDNRFAIRGFMDMNGDEYTGDAYDSDGYIEVEHGQTGIDFYVNGILQEKKKTR